MLHADDLMSLPKILPIYFSNAGLGSMSAVRVRIYAKQGLLAS